MSNGLGEAKKVLLFGATGGIGSAIVTNLERRGYQVVSPTRLECDLSSPDSIDVFLKSVSVEFPSIIFSAGHNSPKAASDTTPAELQLALQINCVAAFQIFNFFAPYQKQLVGASNILVSSSYAARSVPGRMAYASSKAAAELMLRGLAVEHAQHKIRYNLIRPGFIDTPMTSRNNDPSKISELEKKIPAGELGKAEDVARLVSFLISPDSSYCTGSTFAVDGGYGAT